MTLSDSWDTPPSNPNNRRSSVFDSLQIYSNRQTYSKTVYVYGVFASGKKTSGAARRQNVALSPTIVYIKLNGKLTFFLFYLLFPLSKKR